MMPAGVNRRSVVWEGAKLLGLSGRADPPVIQQLFIKNISSNGEVVAGQPRAARRV